MLIFQPAFSASNNPKGEEDTGAKGSQETGSAEFILNAKRIDQY